MLRSSRFSGPRAKVGSSNGAAAPEADGPTPACNKGRRDRSVEDWSCLSPVGSGRTFGRSGVSKDRVELDHSRRSAGNALRNFVCSSQEEMKKGLKCHHIGQEKPLVTFWQARRGGAFDSIVSRQENIVVA